MKTKAGVLWGLNQKWEVEEVELDGPKEREVMVKLTASGLCHSDDHLITGDMPMQLPVVGGHEGAGHEQRQQAQHAIAEGLQGHDAPGAGVVVVTRSALDRTCGQAADEVALEEDEQGEDREGGEDRRRKAEIQLVDVLARELR